MECSIPKVTKIKKKEETSMNYMVLNSRNWQLFGPGTQDACRKYIRQAGARGCDTADYRTVEVLVLEQSLEEQPMGQEPEAVGGERTIAAMGDGGRMELGRKTLDFVRRCKRNPELWAIIQTRAAQRQQEAAYV